MLIEQYPFIDENGNENKNLIKHSSNEGFYIIQKETGNKYAEAIDVYPCKFTYEESEEKIEEEVKEKNEDVNNIE